jgi:hypothetical protein
MKFLIWYYITYNAFQGRRGSFLFNKWIFAVLTKDTKGERVYYESAPRYLDKNLVQMQTGESLCSVREIVELVLQWVSMDDMGNSRSPLTWSVH